MQEGLYSALLLKCLVCAKSYTSAQVILPHVRDEFEMFHIQGIEMFCVKN
jgi:hypothetical protein